MLLGGEAEGIKTPFFFFFLCFYHDTRMFLRLEWPVGRWHFNRMKFIGAFSLSLFWFPGPFFSLCIFLFRSRPGLLHRIHFISDSFEDDAFEWRVGIMVSAF